MAALLHARGSSHGVGDATTSTALPASMANPPSRGRTRPLLGETSQRKRGPPPLAAAAFLCLLACFLELCGLGVGMHLNTRQCLDLVVL